MSAHPDFNTDLAHLLGSIQGPGKFQTSGRIDLFPPDLRVEGVGRIALPLTADQTAQLAQAAEQAPYGRGPETLVDTSVRRSWQIDASKVTLAGKHWPGTLNEIVAQCSAGLGVQVPVRAELYKMLVYETGGFFLSHRDTEKTPGMFATLVLVLPSEYRGGELCIRHGEQEVTLDLSSDDPAEAAYAAFYADCLHEVKPIQSGSRLVLIYNLIREGRGALPQVPTLEPQRTLAAAVLGAWRNALTHGDDALPKKLIYPLDHVYTPAQFGFEHLKGADIARAEVMRQAAQAQDCEFYLAMVSLSESGSANQVDGYYHRGRRYRDDDEDEAEDEFEIEEVLERQTDLSDWQAVDGLTPDLGIMPFDDDELCPPSAFDDAEPDEQSFYEATGNAGASFERSYRRAALVVWPRGARLQLLVQSGLACSVPALANLADTWFGNGAVPAAAEWQEAHALALALIEAWPDVIYYQDGQEVSQPARSASQSQQLLTTLVELDDVAALEAYIRQVPGRGGYASEANAELATALCHLAPELGGNLLTLVVSQNAGQHWTDLAGLLFIISRNSSDAAFHAGAEVLVAQLRLEQPKPQAYYRDHTRLTPQSIEQLLRALERMALPEPAQQAVTRLFAAPESCNPDHITVPAAIALLEHDPAARTWPPIEALIQAARDHLDARIALPLAPPTDFSRPSHLICTCPLCRPLVDFLAHPVTQTWSFKAKETDRRHVEQTLQRSGADVDTRTETYTRPYVLTCTKNQASYRRRVKQREADLGMRQRLV